MDEALQAGVIAFMVSCALCVLYICLNYLPGNYGGTLMLLVSHSDIFSVSSWMAIG